MSQDSSMLHDSVMERRLGNDTRQFFTSSNGMGADIELLLCSRVY